METVFRTISEPAPEIAPVIDVPKAEGMRVSVDSDASEPVENTDEAALSSLGISGTLKEMPQEDRENLTEVGKYIGDIAKRRGLSLTQHSFDRVMSELKMEMGIDPEAEPGIVLGRIAGVLNAWKDLVFIKDPKEKRSLFMKLARMQSVDEMNKAVMKIQEENKIWSTQ